MRIIFAGTPDFALPCLSALIDSKHEVVAVYTQPDRPAGRGRKIIASAVKQRALDSDLLVVQPASLKHAPEQVQLRELSADLMVVVAYGLLLPKPVLDAPGLGCINVHASLLPRWRGAAPIQRAIVAGDATTGISIMQMDEGLDTGSVMLTKCCEIERSDTGASLHDKLMTLGSKALMEVLDDIVSGHKNAQPQDDGHATYAAKLSRADAVIDWSRDSESIERQVRAFNAWPVAQTTCSKRADKPVETLRIWSATCADSNRDGESIKPGTVVATSRDGIDVMTGSGVLQVTELQSSGKRRLHASEFLNAWPLLGRVLGAKG